MYSEEDKKKLIFTLLASGSFLLILAIANKKIKTPTPVFEYKFTVIE